MTELLWIIGVGFVLGVIAMFTSAKDLADSARESNTAKDNDNNQT